MAPIVRPFFLLRFIFRIVLCFRLYVFPYRLSGSPCFLPPDMKHPSAEGIWNKGLTRCVSCDCRPRPADVKNSGCDRVWDIEIYNSSMFTEPHIRYDGLPPKNDAGARYAERFLRFRAARMPVRMRVGRKADGTRPAVSYSPGACRSLPLPYSVPLPFALVRSVRAVATRR